MLRCNQFPILLFFSFIGYSVNSETIPSIQIANYKNDLAYIINASKVVVGANYQEACELLEPDGYRWKTIPTTMQILPAKYTNEFMKAQGVKQCH
ncbi:hypothetical protein ACFORL_08065 [Legionella dresdenensis]|uniref:Legionella vir region protein n=1 Tax=Legionella dresdenensis TaxID=450200 RepID=A0ABV8CFU4_9GAMM